MSMSSVTPVTSVVIWLVPESHCWMDPVVSRQVPESHCLQKQVLNLRCLHAFPVAIWPVPENHCFQEGICSGFMRSRCGNLACARKPLLAARVCAIEPALSDGAVESDERNLQVHDRRSEFAQDFGVFQG